MPFTQSHGLPLLILGSGIALATTLTLTGCTGTPAVEPSPSNSFSSSSATVESTETSSATETLTPEPAPTPSPEITPPVPPEAMKHNNEEGAIAFANYFLDVLEYSAASGDVESINSLSDEECTLCHSLEEIIEDANKKNANFVGLEIQPVEQFTLAVEAENIYGLRGVLEFSGYDLVDREGTVLNSSQNDRVAVGFVAAHEHNSWTVVSFGKETP